MRTAALIVAVAVSLSACATRSDAGEWPAAQLRRWQAERGAAPSPADALAAVLAHDPRAGSLAPALASAPQEPHLDQRRDGPRTFQPASPPRTMGLQVGSGSVHANAPGTTLNDRTPAHFLRGTVDTPDGAALAVDLWSSDASLFHGARMNDGNAPAPADATYAGFDVFPHQRFDLGRGAFVAPLRLGAFCDWQRLDHEPAGVRREFLGLGPRLQLEPTWRLWLDGNDGVELFARIGGDVGATWFSETFQGGNDRASTWRAAADGSAGVRGRWGSCFAELGYRWQHTWIGSIESDLYGDRSRTDLQREQVFLGFGLTY